MTSSRSSSSPRRAMSGRVAAWVARLVRLTGVVDIASAVLPASRPRLELVTDVLPVVGARTAGAATAAAGLLLVFVGAGLRRHKRHAWYVAVALAAASLLLNLVKGLDVEESLLSAGLLALLVATRREFRAAADPASWWRGRPGSRRPGSCSASPRSPYARPARRPPAAAGLARPRGARAVGVTGPLRFTRPGAAQMVSLTTGCLGLTAAGTGVALLLRPGARRQAQSPADERRLRELLARHGERDSLGYFALRPDKSVCWSPTGKAAVAYRVVRGVSLAAWQPRYLCFPTARDLPRIGLAALSAEAFLVTPRPLRRLAGLLRPAPGHAAGGTNARFTAA